MPAYFSIEIAFNRELLTETFVRDFFEVLANNGMNFLEGYWKSKGYTLEQQMEINQKFVEGKADNKDGSYHQSLFSFDKFTEVRGYWSHNHDGITFNLIIPEDDFVDIYTGKEIVKHYDKMDMIKYFFVKVWSFPAVQLIQTAWECSDLPPAFSQINKKMPPQVEPFAIIPEAIYREKWKINYERIDKGGLLLEMGDNWFPC